LPSGETETGTWSVGAPFGEEEGKEFAAASMPFPIPLPTAPNPSEVHYIPSSTTTESCPANNPPVAAPGHVCIYASAFNPEGLEYLASFPSVAGVNAIFTFETGSFGGGNGTFAATAP
jgi:hypothetical protein